MKLNLHPPSKKKKKKYHHILSFPIISKDFSGMKTLVVGEPSADGGFQSAFPCVLQIKYHWPQFLKNYSEGHLSTKNAYSIHSSALVC